MVLAYHACGTRWLPTTQGLGERQHARQTGKFVAAQRGIDQVIGGDARVFRRHARAGEAAHGEVGGVCDGELHGGSG